VRSTSAKAAAEESASTAMARPDILIFIVTSWC
jgi:hypothetical protein